MTLLNRLRAHVIAANRLHGDDTTGILQADAYSGYGKPHVNDGDLGLILEAKCWAHARRSLFCWLISKPLPAESRRASSRRRYCRYAWRSARH